MSLSFITRIVILLFWKLRPTFLEIDTKRDILDPIPETSPSLWDKRCKLFDTKSTLAT